MSILIVRRGLGTFYYQSLSAFARSRNLTLILDRRQSDRRRQHCPVGVDRRGADRRTTVPETWTRADYVAVPDDSILDGPARVSRS